MTRFLLSITRVAIATCSIAAIRAAAVAAPMPQPQHVVVVVEENHSLAQIVGSRHAAYLNALAKRGALFVHAHGVTHPSLPNYLALFAGVTNDNGDGCPATGFDVHAPNLASELLAAHRTFGGYAEALPATGSAVCAAGTYARKHAPWTEFANVPRSLQRPLSALTSFDALPTVAFIIPDVDDDMHDGTIAQADAWARAHLDPLVRWADAHDTLLIVTWDEGYDDPNTVPTFFVGPMVKPGRYTQRIDHYNVLRTLEAMYGLPSTGRARSVATIAGWWR